MTDVRYPRILNTDGTRGQRVYPIRLSLTLNITPLSTATLTLAKGDYIPERSYVELYTPSGSAGVFRVRSPRDAYGDETTTVELEHAITEVGDYLVKSEYSEMMNAKVAMQNIFSHYKGKRWQLGSVNALGTGKIALEAKYNRVLDAMIAILDQKPDCMMSFDFATTPWTVSIVKKDTAVSAEGRLSRNITSAVITYDDTELCTRAYYQTFTKSNGTVVSKWKYKDGSTIKQYGRIEREVATSSDMTEKEIDTTVDTYLNQHSQPRVTISMEAEELSEITGESLDKFAIGKMFRLVIPENNLVITNNITELYWGDMYGNPKNMTVTLGDQEDTVVSFLHDLDSTGASGSGSKKPEEDKWKEFQTYFDKTDYYLKLYAQRVDKQGNILEKAGLDINSKGVLIYSKVAGGLAAYIDVTSTKITSQVMDEVADNYSTIEQTASRIRTAVGSAKSSLYSTIEQTSTRIYTNVTDYVSGNYSTIEQTSTRITAAVASAKSELKSSIQVEADRISLVVEGTGENAHIKPASIVSSINSSGSAIKISADHITLDGHTVASVLDSEDLSVTSLSADTIQCYGDVAFDEGTTSMNDMKILNGGTITIGGTSHTPAWKSYSARYCTLSPQRYFLYANKSGSTTPLTTQTGRICTEYTDTTIHYLGY